MRTRLIILSVLVLVLSACASADDSAGGDDSADGSAQDASSTSSITLVTSSSVVNSGLLDAILPGFEAQESVTVDVIAAETESAVQRNAGVLLLPASVAVDAFVDAGTERSQANVMRSDFVIVGPSSDLAGIGGRDNASLALTMIADAGVTFVSTGDGTPTYSKERAIWSEAGIDPEGQFWYQNTGQDIDAVLAIAEEDGAYTLVERVVFQMANLDDLAVLVTGDVSLRNYYVVTQVNPDDMQGQALVDWLLSVETQNAIATFSIEGQPVFTSVAGA